MPKDINPMPPRTFRGGFLFVQINPHPSKAAIQAGKENCGFSVFVGDILKRRWMLFQYSTFVHSLKR